MLGRWRRCGRVRGRRFLLGDWVWGGGSVDGGMGRGRVCLPRAGGQVWL